MKLLTLIGMALVLGLATPGWSVTPKSGTVEAGVEVGSLTGADLKLWLNHENALELALGSGDSGSAELQASYLWQLYNVFHSDRDNLEQDLPLYFGAGALVGAGSVSPYGSVAQLTALRGVAGISYFFAQEPFDIFLELAPTLYFGNQDSLLLHADVGARYFF
jgi:hypothetical protein